MFNRRTALEPTTKLSYEVLNPPLRQTAVSTSCSVFLLFVVVIYYLLICYVSCTTFRNSLCLSHRLCSKLKRGLRPFQLMSKSCFCLNCYLQHTKGNLKFLFSQLRFFVLHKLIFLLLHQNPNF